MDEKWLVIDAHAHYLPEEALIKAREMRIDPSKMAVANILPTLKKMENIEIMLQCMDESGVGMTLIMQTVWSVMGLDICKAVNDGYSKIKRTYPGRFLLCGQVPIQPGQDVIDEIDRCISELGLNAITLATYSPNFTLDAQELWPMYKKINELGVPIVFHPLMANRWDGTGKYEIRSTVMREYEVSKCVIEVMFGVLKDLPDLKILCPHYGGGMPALRARIRAFYQPEGWPVADVEVNNNGKSPRELDELGLSRSFDELFEKLYFDMAGSGAGDLPMMKAAVATLRTDRMCFGTDYPFDVRVGRDIKYFIDNVKKLEIPDKQKRLMLGENIKSLFNL